MAEIKASSDEKVFRIQEFFGLNENADGDTKLKLGEASVMRNFKITRDRSLQKRPGLDSVGTLAANNVIKIADTAAAVRVDNNVPSTLSMRQEVYLDASNEITLDGNSGQVTYDNWTQYVGYYWAGTDGNYYQFERCEIGTSGSTTTYTWYMKLMTVVPEGQAEAKVIGLWNGNINGKKQVVGAVKSGSKARIVLIWREGDGFLFDLISNEISVDSFAGEEMVTFFGFSNRLYILFGVSMYSWDGETLKDGDDPDHATILDPINYSSAGTGYAPLVAVSLTPGLEGSVVSLQQVSLNTRYVRVWLSPNGTDKNFYLPGDEPYSALQYEFYVKNLITGAYYTRGNGASNGDYYISGSEKAGCEIEIIFNTTLEPGENTIEVCYEAVSRAWDSAFSSGPLRGMNRIEMYNGTTDSRIFYYGNGTNKIYYSDFDDNGVPRAEYVPELNVISVGSENTPVTGLVRHYSRLIAFKEDEAYSIQYGTITLPDNTTTAAFYCTPINRNLGNEAMGQARLVLNSPYTLCGKDLYEWKNNSSYSSNLTIDERQAKRISDRVYATLATFDFSRCYCYDDKDHQEYYVCYDKKALVYNYAADAWYYYTNFDVTCMVNLNGELYAGDSLGRLNLVSRNNRTDNGTEITGYWASGAEPFDREFMRKYSAMLWVVLKPELRSQVTVTVETDRKSDHSKKVAASSVFSFGSADFRRWSFNTNRKPHTTRLKIKAKKFTYYKLILEYSGTNTTATVVAADMRIRYTGYAK